MNERWVCKRCFTSNEGEAAQCERCGLARGSEATEEDRRAWAAQVGLPPPATERPGWQRWLRFWWVPVIGIALAFGYFTTARRGDDGALAGAGTLQVDDLQVGDCFNGGEETEFSDVDAVPCDEPHRFEVFAVADYTGSDFPGTDTQFETAFLEVCVPPFEDYVGTPYDQSELWASAITPTEDGWNDGNREFICYLLADDGTLTGSQRGSRR